MLPSDANLSMDEPRSQSPDPMNEINCDEAQTLPAADRAALHQAPSTKLPGLDVLRGVAALGVGWFHSRVDLWVGFRAIQADPGAYSIVDRCLSYLSLPASQLGGTVMLFFVLSGFCIHLPFASLGREPHWQSYAVRRCLRIYPAYLITLLLCLLAALLLFQAAQQPGELNAYAASALLIQNWVYGGRQVAMNPSLWTIPVEVEAYLLYPLLYWLWRRKGMSAILVYSLICTIAAYLLFVNGFSQASGSFLKYALIWNAGAWLAECHVNACLPRWTGAHGCLLVGTPIATILAGLAGVNMYYLHYGWGLWSVLLLMWVLEKGARFFAIDNWWVPPLVFTGTISYSYYLLHFPIFKLAGAAWIDVFAAKPASFIWPTLATIVMIPIAWCFYVLIEKPTHSLARHFSNSILRSS